MMALACCGDRGHLALQRLGFGQRTFRVVERLAADRVERALDQPLYPRRQPALLHYEPLLRLGEKHRRVRVALIDGQHLATTGHGRSPVTRLDGRARESK
jgi:hypothetical protein